MLLGDRILFLDGEALVLDKPAGMPVTPVRDGTRSVEEMAPVLRVGFQRPPSPAHRLDRDTSGCLLMARNAKALARFGAAFEAGEVVKSYLAILTGVPEGEGGVIDLALGKVSSRADGWRMRPDAKGKPARTRWRRLAVRGTRALILFEPETGRTHQLRVHAAAGLGVPIAGDPVYGMADIRGMMLHAWRLSLARPAKAEIVAEAPFPERFTKLGFEPGDALPSSGA